MRCHFCFATFADVSSTLLPKGHLPKEESLQLTKLLARASRKITFVGGEPTLCPWLPELVKTAKAAGATTMVVTNGSRITPSYLALFEGCLDWIGLSVDSLHDDTNLITGRAIAGKRVMTSTEYLRCTKLVRAAGIRLKLNVTVTSANVNEDLSDFFIASGTERIKIFQVLKVEKQNCHSFDRFCISHDDFNTFVARHQLACPALHIVPENNEAMTGSYLMVDPAGRFFDNHGGVHRYSSPILEAGLEETRKETVFLEDRFEGRGGEWEWG